MYFPAWLLAHFTRSSSRPREASAALDDMSLRKIAVAKRLGKVFSMGIRERLFEEGVHLTSSLSRSEGGESGGLLKAVSQSFSYCAAAAAAAHSMIHIKQRLNCCFVFDVTLFPVLFSQFRFYFLMPFLSSADSLF